MRESPTSLDLLCAAVMDIAEPPLVWILDGLTRALDTFAAWLNR